MDRHRDELAAALRARGLSVATDVGLSEFRVDLALAGPATGGAGRGRAARRRGVGARRTVGDRDGLPVKVLGRMMGWTAVERVWLPEWLNNPDAVLDRLESAVHAPLSAAEATLELVPPVTETSALLLFEDDDTFPVEGEDDLTFSSEEFRSRTEPSSEALADAEPGPSTSVFHPWRVRLVGDSSWLDALDDLRAQDRVQGVISEIVAAEGPVQLERLCRLTANAFDLSRVASSRISAISRLVPRNRRDEYGFVWSEEGAQHTFIGFRLPASSGPRPLEEVHPQEIANAMGSLATDAWGIDEDELIRETLNLFGWKRLTDSARTPLSRGLEIAVAQGILERRDGLIHPVER